MSATNGTSYVGKLWRVAKRPLLVAGMAGAIALGAAIARNQDIGPNSVDELQYNGSTSSVTAQVYDTYWGHAEDCPIKGFRDQNYWAAEIARLSGKDSPYAIVNIGERLEIPTVCVPKSEQR